MAHIFGLKEVLYLQKKLGDLTFEIQTLQGILSGAPIVKKQSEHPKVIKKVSPPVSTEKIKHKYSAKDKAYQKLAFPFLIRAFSNQISHDPEPTNDEQVPDTSGQAKGEKENESDEFEQLASDSEEEEAIKDESDYEASQPVYKKLKIIHIKELHSAVKNYGVNAPFTVSILEGLAGDCYLTPNEWSKVVQSVLTRGQYLTWKSDFVDRAKTQAANNRKNPLSKAYSWTSDKIFCKGPFASDKKQLGLSPGVLAQTAQAALAAWRAVPATGALITPLTKTIQGSQESYAQFVARLQERVLGPHENEGLLVRQHALENANSACKAALGGKTRGFDLIGIDKALQ